MFMRYTPRASLGLYDKYIARQNRQNGGDASKTRRVRLCRREHTKTYVTKAKHKPDKVLQRIYVALMQEALDNLLFRFLL